jgi:hypothetical protein
MNTVFQHLNAVIGKCLLASPSHIFACVCVCVFVCVCVCVWMAILYVRD